MIKTKSDLRLLAHDRRAALERGGFAEAIATRAAELGLASGAVVSGYWPMSEEADPRELLRVLAASGHPLALPRVSGKGAPLVFHRWTDGETLITHRFGMSEPHADGPVVVPDVVLVPMLAFDHLGYRLGYGGGFYDRTLETLRGTHTIKAIGIAYAGQEMDAVPRESHDQRLDAVLTENGLRNFG